MNKKRAVCPHCEFIRARCLCDTLKLIDNKTQIIILQHPSEMGHALNTVALMKKSFMKMDVFIGEDFSEHLELNSLIEHHQETIGLIFPTEKKVELHTFPKRKLTHLLFLDGTWKKAYKMYRLSKNLHQLLTFSLVPTKPGQYKIRSSHFEQGVSTLEATICALLYIEESLDTKSLEDSFAKMIGFQIEKMGQETFKKNYQKDGESEDPKTTTLKKQN